MDLTQVALEVGALLLIAVIVAVLVSIVFAAWKDASVRRQVLERGGYIAAVAFSFIVISGYLFGWKWTGFPDQTFWGWLKLLVVPTVLAIGGYLFNRSESKRTEAAAEERTRDEALQAYLDKMSDMLIANKDRTSLYDEHSPDSLRTVARARTLTVLPRLDRNRKARVIQFLYEAGLIKKGNVIVDLSEADLREADLRYAKLVEADLRYTLLQRANLSNANLSGADLRKASLNNAVLVLTDLSGADLSGIHIYVADFQGANLSNADLSNARLSDANLSDVDLSGADLSGAHRYPKRGSYQLIPNEELEQQAKSLKGTTMPNRQKYEDWLKDTEGRGEDGENSDAS
jgi:hypothetical protein